MNDQITLITVDDVKQGTSISNQIDSELIQPYLAVGEQIHCYTILGDALLTEVKSQITGNTLTSLNSTLLNQYIKPLCIYASWFEASLFLNFKTANKGLLKQSSDNSENLSLDELSFYRSSLKDKVGFYSDRLKKYLECNKESYPLYRTNINSNNTYTGAIYLGRFN